MSETGAGVRVVGGSLHVGLRAFLRPPARSISLRIAHFDTADSQVRFRTVAVATACGYAPQKPWDVREKCGRAGQEDDSQEVQPPEEKPPWDGSGEEPEHWGILRRVWQKTDGPGSSKILLLGSWNHMARARLPVLDGDRAGFRRETVPN
jgi:hypothetical protein